MIFAPRGGVIQGHPGRAIARLAWAGGAIARTQEAIAGLWSRLRGEVRKG
ncbi:hypothetical protein [Laspinema palackyanum]|nr:hypothetical protein [Laspinema sp. D2c]